MLDVQPSDSLLEIGCGQGVAVSLICGSLSTGSIVAIDRSRPMIEQASRRNRACLERSRARFLQLALAEAGSLLETFDKAFAINVRLFDVDGAAEAEVLARLLESRGALYLFQQHPSAERTQAVTAELESALERNGLYVRDRLSSGTGDSSMTCLVAGLSQSRGRPRVSDRSSRVQLPVRPG